MRSAAASPYSRLVLTVLCLSVSLAAMAQQEAAPEEKKPGFFKRITKGVSESVGGIFKKDEPPPATPTPEPKKAEAKPKSSPPAKKAETTKAKAKPTTPSSSPTKTTTKPKLTLTDTSSPKKKTTVVSSSTKPVPKKEAPPATKAKTSDISEAFGASSKMDVPPASPSKPAPEKKPEPKAANTAATPSAPPDKDTTPAGPTPDLPASDGSWEIVKLGHDYVTADSIQRFYRFSSLKVDGNHVWLRSPTIIMKATIGSQELLINNIKFILSYPTASKGDKALFSRVDLCKLIDPVLRPSHIDTSEIFDTVVIDAGHGGHDSGARGVYGYEKDFALKMALSVRDALTKRGFKTVLTRSDDTFISLGGRFAVANATPRSIFISLHFNSGGSAASGIETFALSPEGTANTQIGRSTDFSSTNYRTGNKRDSENIALATAVHAMVVHRFKLVDRGIKRARWSVLTGCSRPSILFEGGFVTNSQDCRLIASPTYRDAIATAIGDAVVNYRKALQPRVVGPSGR
jgi:N-acetylmuramoyl-L-alanine amidase